MEKSLHCVVAGKVQGVYFRAFVQEQAQSLGLRGWVRNLADGKLEMLAQGSDEAQKALVDRLWQGPALARVEHVETSHIDYDKTYPGFEIRG